jgi:hypothetical protein
MKPSKQFLIAQQLNSGKITKEEAAEQLRKMGEYMAADMIQLTN